MAHKSTIDAYNKIAIEYSHRNSVSIWVKEYEIFFNLVPEGKSVIEIGCGTGRDAKFLGSKYAYSGIDASEGMLSIALKNVPEGNFFLRDFYKLDFPANTFDAFWAAASLLHVPKSEINQPLLQIKNVVKPNGIGFISIKEKSDLDEGVIKQEKSGIERYFSFYTKEEFKNILETNNFEIITMTEELENDSAKTNWLCYFIKVLK